MNNKLFYLDNEERSRILNLHENRTKSQYLKVLNNNLSESIDRTYFWGVSPDEKIFFTNKNLYVNEGDELKKLEYDLDSLPYILETARKKCDKMLKEGKMTLNNYLSVPKKFLTSLMENWDINKGVRQEINEHWDNKFKDSIKLLTENRKLIFENGLNYQLWEEVNLVANQLITEWNLWDAAKSVGSTVWSGVKKVGSAIATGAKKVWEGISKAAGSLLSWILKQGVIPALRWIRRNLNSYMGMIVEIIASMFPTVVVVKVIWCMIVILDIYEILYDDYDPKDPDRKAMPFLFLMTDILSLVVTAAAGAASKLIFKTAVKQAATKGAVSSQAKGLLSTVLKSLPGLSSTLKYAENVLVKLFGKSVGGFLGKIFSGINSIVTKLGSWIKTTFKLGETAAELGTKKGLTKAAVGLGMGITLAEFFKENTLYKGMTNDERVKQAQNGILINKQFHPELTYKGPATGNFDTETEIAVKQLQKKLELPITGKIDPPMAMALNVDLGPGNLEKLVGKTNLMSFGEKMMAANQWLENKLGKTKGSLT